MPFSFVRHAAALGCAALIVLSAVHCSSSSSGPSSSTGSSPASSAIGPAGGTVASSDGAMEITIPAGVLTQNVTITIAVTTSPATGSVGNVYEIGPSGTTFAAPITMTFHYAGVDLGGHQPNELRVGTAVAGAWQLLAGFAEDAGARTVSGTTTHLSPYAMVLEANGQLCATFGGLPNTCTPGSSCPPPPTCETSTPCADFVGATQQSCMNGTSGSTYVATCCFPAGIPACVTATVLDTCTPGSTCPPTTCATSNPTCEPGAMLKSCTPQGTGFTTTCCYPPGVAPPDPTMPDSGAPPADSGTPLPDSSAPTADSGGGPCGPATCPTGCCTAVGNCLDFGSGQQSMAKCGNQGAACMSCVSGTCVSGPAGGGQCG
jgi:hypothetical protein